MKKLFLLCIMIFGLIPHANAAEKSGEITLSSERIEALRTYFQEENTRNLRGLGAFAGITLATVMCSEYNNWQGKKAIEETGRLDPNSDKFKQPGTYGSAAIAGWDTVGKILGTYATLRIYVPWSLGSAWCVGYGKGYLPSPWQLAQNFAKPFFFKKA